MNVGRVARSAVPVAAAAVGVAAASRVLGGDPEPGAPAPPSQSQAGAAALEPEPANEPGVEPDPVPAPAPARRTYTNPVFAENAPDPTVVRGEDGMFYAFTTESAWLPFQVLRSPDLRTWERVGGAFEGQGPAWIKEHRWAPDVARTGDHYTMTHSGRGHDGRMKIGYATSPTAQGPYTDRGILVEGQSGGYFIDSHLQQTDEGWKLYYGSTGGTSPRDQTGISVRDVDIAADGSLSLRGDAKVVVSEQGERELVEGAWMHQKNGQYYLFYSDGRWDAKGGAEDYALKVARSASPDGPFEKLGAPILQQGNGYAGTGHNSIVTDDAGQDWLMYHAWGADHSTGRVLMMDPIEWRDGWPVVNDGTGPSNAPMDAPVIAALDGAAALAA